MLLKLGPGRMVNVVTGTLIRTFPDRPVPTVEYTPVERLTGGEAIRVIEALQLVLLRQHQEVRQLLGAPLGVSTVELQDGEVNEDKRCRCIDCE